jgi:hypothetical protein
VAAEVAAGKLAVTQTLDGRLVATGSDGREIQLEADTIAAVAKVAKDVKVTVQQKV